MSPKLLIRKNPSKKKSTKKKVVKKKIVKKITAEKRGRGRPRKVQTEPENKDVSVKRGRGRPKKAQTGQTVTDVFVKRGRGRPRKAPPMDLKGSDEAAINKKETDGCGQKDAKKSELLEHPFIGTLCSLNPMSVETGWRARKDLGDISALASSIAKVGQVHPIKVIKNGTEKVTLVAGFRRLRACQQLGIDVRAEVTERPKEEVITIEQQLDENLTRKDFDVLERAEGLNRLKQLYEKQNPETVSVREQGGPGRGHVADKSVDRKPAFTKIAAQKFNCSVRHIQEMVQIGNMSREFKDKVNAAKTSAARNEVARECLSQIRKEAKTERLAKLIEEKRQRTIDDQLDATTGMPAVVMHCGNNKDFMKGTELYELVLTDPPFSLERSSIAHVSRASINPKQDWDKLDIGWVVRAAPLLVKGGSIVAFCPLEAIGAYEAAFKIAEMEYRGAMLWVKSNPAPVHRSSYASAVEAMVWASKPGAPYYFSEEVAKAGAASLNVFNGASVPGSSKDRFHPAQKPEWLITKLLRNHAHVRLQHRVLDPFAGAGTTGVCCKKLKLACTMIELDENYVKKARLRLELV
jgi:DNA modification methylase